MGIMKAGFIWAAFLLTLFAGIIHAQSELDQGLVAYFPFDGNVNDVSSTHAKAVAYGPVEYQPGIAGTALVLNGHSYVRVEDCPALNLKTFTLSAWVCRFPNNNNSRILEKGSGHSYWLYLFGERAMGGFFGEDFADAISSSRIPFGKWTHVCSTYDGSKLCLYMNGSLEATTAVQDPVATTSRPLFIGSRGGKTDNWIGGIDEVKIYNRALSPAEVEQLFHQVAH